MPESRLRKAEVFFNNHRAGIIEETKQGYRFAYDEDFLKQKQAISISLPLKQKIYESDTLFLFFAGLLPEGWYLDIVVKTLKVDRKDLFGLLLATCQDTAGAVSIRRIS